MNVADLLKALRRSARSPVAAKSGPASPAAAPAAPTKPLRLQDEAITAIRFGLCCIIAGNPARPLGIEAPEGLTVTLDPAKGRLGDDPTWPAWASALRRRIFPDAASFHILSAQNWPTDVVLRLTAPGTDEAVMLTPAPVDALAGPPVGVFLDVFAAPTLASAPRLMLDEAALPLDPQPSTDALWCPAHYRARLPAQIFDGDPHRFELVADGRVWVAPEAQDWQCRGAARRASIEGAIARRPTMLAAPPGDIRSAREHALARTLRDAAGARKAAIDALTAPIEPMRARVRLYVFAPTVEVALSTPAIAQLSARHGGALLTCLTAPSTEAALFGTAVAAPEARLDQLARIVGAMEAFAMMRRQREDVATVIVPGGAALDPEAMALIDRVLAGESEGADARPLRVATFAGCEIRVRERAVAAVPVTPDRIVAVYSQDRLMRALQVTTQEYDAMPVSSLVINAPTVGAPFAAVAYDMSAPPRPIPVTVLAREPDALTDEAIDALAALRGELVSAGLDLALMCSRIQDAERAARCPSLPNLGILAPTMLGVSAERAAIDALTPVDQPVLIIDRAALAAFRAAQNVDVVAGLLRLGASLTEEYADLQIVAPGAADIALRCHTRRPHPLAGASDLRFARASFQMDSETN